jgi:hypothetical protein
MKKPEIKKMLKRYYPELAGAGLGGVPLALLLTEPAIGVPLSLATAGGIVGSSLIDEKELKKKLGEIWKKRIKKVM